MKNAELFLGSLLEKEEVSVQAIESNNEEDKFWNSKRLIIIKKWVSREFFMTQFTKK